MVFQDDSSEKWSSFYYIMLHLAIFVGFWRKYLSLQFQSRPKQSQIQT